jgi:hypothetical protein
MNAKIKVTLGIVGICFAAAALSGSMKSEEPKENQQVEMVTIPKSMLADLLALSEEQDQLLKLVPPRITGLQSEIFRLEKAVVRLKNGTGCT